MTFYQPKAHGAEPSFRRTPPACLKEDDQMTDQTIAQEIPDDDEDEGGGYDLAYDMKYRCAGFAYLLENTAEHVGFINGKDVEGIAQIAKDIAEKAVELYEHIRLERLETSNAKKEA
jgi:hypothetical protein